MQGSTSTIIPMVFTKYNKSCYVEILKMLQSSKMIFYRP